MTMFDLTGRVALVTGGNGGIGLGMARGLAAAGATVAIAARNTEKAAAAVAALGDRSIFIPLDVADESSCRAMVEQVSDWLGRLDILVNNAGTSIRKPPEAYTAAEWHAVLDTNLTGAFLCSQAAHPVMKRSGGSKIINIGSMFALFGSAYAAPYAASKGALAQWTKSLAAERGLARLDLIKIDVEGHERQVLDGAAAIVDRHRPVLVIETGHEADGDRAAIHDRLAGLGASRAPRGTLARGDCAAGSGGSS